MPLRSECSKRRGLARQEIVAIVVIALVFLALLFPYLQRQRANAQRLFCERKQHHVGFALLRYEQHYAAFPGYRNLQALDANETPQPASWVFPISPFIFPTEMSLTGKQAPPRDKQGPYSHIHEDFGPTGEEGDRGSQPSVRIAELFCPSDRPLNRKKLATQHMSFVVNSGMPDSSIELANENGAPIDWPANGVFMNQFDQAEIKAMPATQEYINEHDGAEYVLMLSENIDSGTWVDSKEAQVGFVWNVREADGFDAAVRILGINQQIAEGDGSIRFARPSSYHVGGGVNAVYCSWRTEFINQEIDYLVLAKKMMPSSRHIMLPGTQDRIGSPYRTNN